MDSTPEEQRNIELVKQYMEIAYSPQRASAQAVAHLCAPNNRFIAPTTFPDVHTLEAYAEDHAKVMKQVNDLHFVSFDVLFAKGDRVCLRYTARKGYGQPYAASKDSLVLFREGRLDRIIDAAKEACKDAAYQPFRELEQLKR